MIYLISSILNEWWWVIILGILGFMYVSREASWYWKINELIKLLTEIRDLLKGKE